jgi:hypothetical protein
MQVLRMKIKLLLNQVVLRKDKEIYHWGQISVLSSIRFPILFFLVSYRIWCTLIVPFCQSFHNSLPAQNSICLMTKWQLSAMYVTAASVSNCEGCSVETHSGIVLGEGVETIKNSSHGL